MMTLRMTKLSRISVRQTRKIVNDPSVKNNRDPRSTWKESGEILTEEAKKVNPAAKVSVPDAITQTDNSAKRMQVGGPA